MIVQGVRAAGFEDNGASIARESTGVKLARHHLASRNRGQILSRRGVLCVLTTCLTTVLEEGTSILKLLVRDDASAGVPDAGWHGIGF